ncbi:MAG: hypothetical protein RRZ69_00290 [Clostridia bacterium]
MFKKIIIAILVVALVLSFAGCSKTSYEYGPIAGGANASDAVVGNGNYVVQKGNFIYYINSIESVSGKNTLGLTNAGGIVRANLDGSSATMVFPKLVANASKTGLFIFGDRIYFTSPCDSVNSSGAVQSNLLDIMSVKLDGSNAKKHITLSSNSLEMTFMEDGGVVYLVYVQDGIVYKLNTSVEKAKKEVFLEDFTSKLFAGNSIVYTKTALLDKEEKVEDRYSEVFSITPNGKETKLFDGNSTTNVKYKIEVVDVVDGKLYYVKKDDVLSLENATYCRSFSNGQASNDEKKVSTTPIAKDGVLTYNFNGKNGVIVSASGIGTVYFGNDGEIKRISSSALSMSFVKDKYLYFTNVSETAGKVNRYDVDKILTTTEKVTSEQVFGYKKSVEKDGETKEETVYDTFYAFNFLDVVSYGDNVFFYSGSQTERKMTVWNMTSDTMTVISVADKVLE